MLAVASSIFIVAGCAQVPARTANPAEQSTAELPAADEDDGDSDAGQTAESPSSHGMVARKKGKTRAEPLPSVDLTAKVLYQLVLAELAAQNGSFSLSVSAYLDLAISTRDPRIARRAAEIALHGRDIDAALQAARLWVEIDPESPLARQMLTGLLVNVNRMDDLAPQLSKLFSLEGENVGAALLGLNRLFVRYPDKQAVQKFIEQITVPYIGLAETHMVRAQAAQTAGDIPRGLEEIDKALTLRPDWDPAIMLKAQLQGVTSVEKALDTLRAYLAKHPKAREVRQQYASGLVGDHKYPEARVEFERLLKDNPDNLDVIYAVAILSLQLQDYVVAEENFRKLIDSDYGEANTARMYLGQIAEERKQFDSALSLYGLVTQGDQYLPAQLRIAQVLSRLGKLDEGRRHLRQAQVSSAEDRMQLLVAEAQLLREAGQVQAAYDLLDSRLKAQPDQPDLLYETALLAERLGHLDILEARLRRLIEIKPDHAHAYNALGYTFAEHNQRLNEAQQLVAKALQLAPDDPFILDSMGWVQFRMGDNQAALGSLQRAFMLRPDPEIAAHLGEVLWVMGRRDDAKKTLGDAVKSYPDNEALIEVVKRLIP